MDKKTLKNKIIDYFEELHSQPGYSDEVLGEQIGGEDLLRSHAESMGYIDEMVDVFEKQMKRLSPELQADEGTVGLYLRDIYMGYRFGERAGDIWRHNTKEWGGNNNMHMAYYDTALGFGEAEKIERALMKYNLTDKVLRGVPGFANYKSVPIPVDGGYIEIEQRVENNDNSGEVVYFVIKFNGEIIYEFGAADDDDMYFSDDEREALEDYFDEQVKKFGEKLKSTGVNKSGMLYREIVDKNGNTQLHDVKGRFTSKRK